MSGPNGYAQQPYSSYTQSNTFDPYQSQARTQYGSYDPRYPYGRPSAQHQDKHSAATPPAQDESGYAFQTDATPVISDQFKQMNVGRQPSSSSHPHPHPHPHHQQQQFQQHQQTVRLEHDSYSGSHPYPQQHTTQHSSQFPADFTTNGYPDARMTQPFDAEVHRSSNRPVSSSASGIISMYSEDYPSAQSPVNPESTGTFASQPFNGGYPTERSSSTFVSGPSAVDYRHPSQRASRPLPVTPGQQISLSYNPDYSPRSEHYPAPDEPKASDKNPSTQNYFNMASPQPSGSSYPTTPAATHQSAASTTSSRTYPSPAWSPSASVDGTPGSSHGHRPLPSTGSTLDGSFSPQQSSSPVSAFRSPSQSQSNSRRIISSSQMSSTSSYRRKESFPNIGNRKTSTSGMSANGEAYGADSWEGVAQPGVPRQRTQSDASRISYKPTKSQRQPLPPVPNMPSVHNGMLRMTSADLSASNPRAAYDSSSILAAQSLDHSDSAQTFAESSLQSPTHEHYRVDRLTSIGEADKRLKTGHGRIDPLTWDSVNGGPVRAAAGLHMCPDSSSVRIEWALLSTVAMLLRANVPRGTQIKGSIDYPKSFTGKDVVSTLQDLLLSTLAESLPSSIDLRSEQASRQVALLLAKTLKSQLFFHEVDWGENDLTDGVDEVYAFLEDSLAGPGATAEDADDWTAGLSHSDSMKAQLELSLTGRDGATSQSKRVTSPARPSDLDELPTGVFTLLTRCYSPLCNASGPYSCYSTSCPNSMTSPLRDPIPGLGRKTTRRGNDATPAADQSYKKAWAELVPPELLKSIPVSEIARQNAILETIQKEEEFLSDLELLDSLFVRGLQKPSETGDPPPLPIGPERDTFLREVFGNHLELTAHIRELVERLHIRQREESPIIHTIGDLFLSAALDWGQVYNAYLTNYPLAINRVKREISVNPRFKTFVEACRRHPAAHKHPLENFLFRPPARLQRYHLHLESILKKTEEENNDRANLEHAIEIINDQCKTAQEGVEAAELKVKIREYAYNLSAKRNKSAVDMDLLNPDRQLVHQGRVLRKPDAFDFDWTELLAILFDNYFIVAKQKRILDAPEDDNSGNNMSSSGARFIFAKRPIPVEMLEISGVSDAPISRSIGLSNFHISREREARDFWPFTVSHLGGKVEPMTLYAPSKEARNEWKRKLDEAVQLRMAIQNSNMVFEQQTLSDDVFALAPSLSLEPERAVPGVDAGVFHGRVTCAVPFVTADRRRLVAVGCADGVWIGLRNDAKSLRKVLHLKFVTQCAVLESFGIFVVLADKVLISYSLEALVPTSSSSAASLRPPQKLSGNRDVLFFNVGVLKDRTLLIYMKKKANESVFRALEPVLNAPRANEGKAGSGFFGKFSKDSKNSDWFRIYKTFFIPSEAYSIQFLKSKLCIICAKGFEIMNLDSLLPGTIPDFAHAARDDPRILQLQKRVETAKPLGMFKTSDSEFLLCYDAFACYLDRLGEPIRLDQIIEWEGFPKQVAFSGNYVLAFDHRFVEIRDTQNGRLVQILRGADVRYVSGNSTITTSSSESAMLLALDAEINPVILTKRVRAAGRIPFDFQRVVELRPSLTMLKDANSFAPYTPPFTRSATLMSDSSRGSGTAYTPSTAPSGWI